MANLFCPRNWPLGKSFLPTSNVILGYTDRRTMPTSLKVLEATSGLDAGIRVTQIGGIHPRASQAGEGP